MPSRIEVVNGSVRVRSSESMLLAFLLQEAAVVLDHQVFRRIGADGGSVGLLAHSPGNFSFLRGFKPCGTRRCLGRGRRRRRRSVLVSSQTSSPERLTVSSRSLAGFLRRIAVGRLPDFPGVVVVDHRARRHGEIEDAGDQIALMDARLRV